MNLSLAAGSSAPTFVAYYRVSTQRQGRSGLGLEAQRHAVTSHVTGTQGMLLREFTEIETGKGTNALDRRPELREALDHCRKQKATLLIAKLDRLARNVHFVSGLIESGVDFVAADMPQANKTMIQIFAAMSEWERDEIARRTRAALAAAKARGVRLGETGPKNIKRKNQERRDEALRFADRIRSLFNSYLDRKMTQREMVDDLNRLGITTPRGRSWSLIQVQRVIRRLRSPAAIDISSPDAGTW